MKKVIELKDIEKTYYLGEIKVPVLKQISLDIYEGEFVSIMGPSGSGKSTLLNILGCLDRSSEGKYTLAGKDISTLDADTLSSFRGIIFGFIFQRYNLINGLTAVENVEIPAVYTGSKQQDRKERAIEILNSLGLNERLSYKPSQLSGGQQQRVSIARALMNGGKVILADEPTGALDSKTGVEVMQLLHKLHEVGHTVIVVTHDVEVAKQADRIIRISDGCIVSDEKLNEQKNESGLSYQVKLKDRNFLVNLKEAFRMAFRSLQINKFRTFLTMLGIIIGVSSVITMLAIGNGAKQEIIQKIESEGGVRMLMIFPGAPGMRHGGSNVITLIPDDAKSVSKIPGVDKAVPEMSKTVITRYGNKDFESTATATSEEYSIVKNWNIKRGVFFQKKDVNNFSQVAVVGQTVIDNLFDSEVDPIGKHFLIGNVMFTVIGIMESKGADFGGNDQDNIILIPLSTGRVRLFGQTYLRSISIQAEEEYDINQVQENIRLHLIKRHKNLEDFKVRSLASFMAMVSETQNTLTYLLGSIAIISLIVGGIGVMNIMLVSVRERTREIGIRIAVGAKASDVLSQFLTEALAVCLIGGLIGIAMGFAAGMLVSETMGWATIYTMDTIILAFSCSVVIGLIFGYLPAKKAAKLDPVVALTME